MVYHPPKKEKYQKTNTTKQRDADFDRESFLQSQKSSNQESSMIKEKYDKQPEDQSQKKP